MLHMRRSYAPNRIREARKAKNMSQEELGSAMQAELSGSTVAKLENGGQGLTLDYLLDIAGILQVPVTALLPSGAPSGRMVRLVALELAGNWSDQVKQKGETRPIPEHLEGENNFVCLVDGNRYSKLFASGEGDCSIVVNPDDKELLDRKFYVVQDGNGEISLKQFSANPLALVSCSIEQPEPPVPLGAEPFAVIGRIIHTGQDL